MPALAGLSRLRGPGPAGPRPSGLGRALSGGPLALRAGAIVSHGGGARHRPPRPQPLDPLQRLLQGAGALQGGPAPRLPSTPPGRLLHARREVQTQRRGCAARAIPELFAGRPQRRAAPRESIARDPAQARPETSPERRVRPQGGARGFPGAPGGQDRPPQRLAAGPAEPPTGLLDQPRAANLSARRLPRRWRRGRVHAEDRARAHLRASPGALMSGGRSAPHREQAPGDPRGPRDSGPGPGGRPGRPKPGATRSAARPRGPSPSPFLTVLRPHTPRLDHRLQRLHDRCAPRALVVY